MAGAGDGTGKTPITAEEIMAEELYGVLLKSAIAAAPLPLAVIDRKLRAAEDSLEHELSLFFGEKTIVSEATNRGISADTYDLEEPAYDYPLDLFQGGRWGAFELRYRPVVSFQDFFISLPGNGYRPSIRFPIDWLKGDKKFGTVRIVPTSGASILGLFQGLVLPIIGGGTDIPHAIFVDYTAGISKTKLLHDHNDLLEAVRIRATLGCFGIATTIRNQGLGSHTLSQDGQSRSESFMMGKWGPYSGAIEIAMARQKEILSAWIASERGIVMGFL